MPPAMIEQEKHTALMAQLEGDGRENRAGATIGEVATGNACSYFVALPASPAPPEAPCSCPIPLNNPAFMKTSNKE